MTVIYKAKNIINNKIYIGQSVQFKKRKWRHLYESKKNNPNNYFHRAIKKYGEESFEWTIIEEIKDELANEREIYWIAFYNSSNDKYGYNLTLGGGSGRKPGFKHTKETKLKMSNSTKEYYKNNYEERYKETKLILVFDNKGNKIYEGKFPSRFAKEHNIIISSVYAALNNSRNSAGSFIFFYKENYSEKKLNDKISKMCSYKTKIKVMNKNTKEVIGIYQSKAEAARILGLDSSSITKCIKKIRYSHKGYIFEEV